ncbi:uncharacterized protein PRCAT00004268001 [Priceomyces carsonii]|uniref:uncharacterized protein n=1 Tax=Priceomyces carsonii TaxID=28549 RepID=UPI002ED8E368|nr:unnamed protein product [Priceomyces carsonii]
MISDFTSQGIYYSFMDTSASTNASVIVFLHGLGSSQNFYYSIAHQLSKSYRCLLIDNDGAGRSQLTHTKISVESDALLILDILRNLELDDKPLIFIGHSMAGMIVNFINAQFQDVLNIKKNVLISPLHPFIEAEKMLKERVNLISAKGNMIDVSNSVALNAVGSLCSDLKKGFIRELVSSQKPDYYIANCELIIRELKSSGTFENYYRKIQAPTLFILGNEDKTAPWEKCVEVIVKNIKEKRVVFLTGVGHWAAIERDDEVEKEISEFL